MTKPIWLIFGHSMVVLGVIGVFLPVLPTTPFILLAAFAYSRGSRQMEEWLLRQPYFGPAIIDWRQRGVIRLRAKIVATCVISISAVSIYMYDRIPLYGRMGMLITMLCVILFLWSRPSK